jgi:general L-amino acid transport system substrate-binding protein
MRPIALIMILIMMTSALAGCLAEDDIEVYNLEINDLNVQKEQLDAEILSLNEQLETLVSQMHLEEIENNQQVSDLQQEISDLNNEILLLENQISEMSHEILLLENQISEMSPVSTLDTIIERGNLKCGVKFSQKGMGYLSADGSLTGLDIKYCRAIAAAIGLNPDTDIDWVETSAVDRFEKLSSGTIDVLIRTTTKTTSRDTSLNADFTSTNFFDGLALIVNGDKYSYGSINTLSGISICVITGTFTESIINEYFSLQGISISTVSASDPTEIQNKFESGDCDAASGDRSGLADNWLSETDVDSVTWNSWITPEVISKEPLSAAVRDYDSEWKEIVEWVWHGMVTAEELGIDSSNYQNADTTNYEIQRLLEQNLGLGTESNPLNDTWMQDVLEHVGNYGEAYSGAFCGGNIQALTGTPQLGECAIFRQGSLNDLVSGGGVMYAPPFR